MSDKGRARSVSPQSAQAKRDAGRRDSFLGSCGGIRDRWEAAPTSEDTVAVTNLSSVLNRFDEIKVVLDRQTLAQRNASARQQECLDHVSNLESKVEIMLAALNKVLLAEAGGSKMKDAVKESKDNEVEAVQVQPATKSLSREDIQDVAESLQEAIGVNAVGQKYIAIESQLQAVQIEVKRLSSQNSNIEQYLTDQTTKIADQRVQLEAYQSKLDASYQAFCEKLAELKPSTITGPSMLAGLHASPAQPQITGDLLDQELNLLSAEPTPHAKPSPRYDDQDVKPEGSEIVTGDGLDDFVAEGEDGSKVNYNHQASVQEVDAYEKAMGWQQSKTSLLDIDHDPNHDFITKVSLSTPFVFLCSVMIVLNMMFMGAEGDLMVRSLLDRVSCKVDPYSEVDPNMLEALRIIDWTFFCWMTIELFVNVWGSRAGGCQDWKWNLFDAFILVTSLLQLLVSTTNLSILRMGKLYKLVKVLRMGKVLKVLRVFRFLTGVRKMVLSVLGSLTSLFWAFFLMSLIMYVVSILFLQGIEGHLADVLEENKALLVVNGTTTTQDPGTMFYGDYQQIALLQKWYGGIGLTMLTLFRTISGGAEWAEVAEPVAEMSFPYLLLWIAFMGFMMFGVLNILTGVFCDSAMKAASDDREMAIQEMMQEQESAAKTVKKFFEEADTDGSGYVSREEFMEVITHPDAEYQLMQLGINQSEATGLFNLLDDDESGEVGIHEFITGALRVKGGAKAVDMVTLLFENKKLKRHIAQISVNIDAVMKRLNVTPGILKGGKDKKVKQATV